MVSIWWNHRTYTHCLLIIPIALYLINRRRDALDFSLAKANLTAAIFACVLAVGWYIGVKLKINFVQHAAIVTLLPTLFFAVFGVQFSRPILFPLLYLLFAIPVGDFLVPALQDITADFSVAMLRLTGLPVYFEGLYIYIPKGSFVVAEACSGINYLIASIALGFLYAHLQYRSMTRKVIFIALSFIIPILANGLRAYGIIMIAHLSDMKYAVGVDHLVYGWLFFGFVILLLFWIGNFFSDRGKEPEPSGAINWGVTAITAQHWVSASLFVVSGALAVHFAGKTVTIPEQLPEASYATALTAWQSQEQDSLPPLGGRFQGSLRQSHNEYRGGASVDRGNPPGGQLIGVDTALYYPGQPEGEMVNRTNRWFDPEQYRRLDEQIIEIADFPVRQHKLRHITGQEYVVYSWYQISGTVVAGSAQAKLIQAREEIIGADSYSIAVSVYSKIKDGERTPSDAHKDAIKAIIAENVTRLELSE